MVFGIYAAFLFAKTGKVYTVNVFKSLSLFNIDFNYYFDLIGHFIASFTAHSFCNHMGFPDLFEVIAYKHPLKRAGLLCLFLIGLVAWCFLLTPMTNPVWFDNTLFWNKHFV